MHLLSAWIKLSSTQCEGCLYLRFRPVRYIASGISSTVLSERLLDLEREGLVTKKIYPEVPPRVEYSMMSRAKELEGIIKELGRWAEKWKSPPAARLKTTAVAAQKES